MRKANEVILEIIDVLLKEWNPIAVYNGDNSDEYDMYAYYIYSSFVQNSELVTKQWIFDFLYNLELNYIGISNSKEKDEHIAEKVYKILKKNKIDCKTLNNCSPEEIISDKIETELEEYLRLGEEE